MSRTNGRIPISTPERVPRPTTTFVSPDPHSEMNHREALEAAKKFHDSIQARARLTLEKYHLELAQKEVEQRRKHEEERARLQKEILVEQAKAREAELQRLQDLQIAEKSRIAAEEKKVQETARLRDLQAKKVTPPPLPSPSPPPQNQTASTPASAAEAPKITAFAAPPVTAAPSNQASQIGAAKPGSLSVLLNSEPVPTQSQTPNAQLTPSTPTVNSVIFPSMPQVKRVHKNLKKLRASMSPLSGQPKNNPQLKAVVGEMRRNLGKWVGQLSMGTGQNKKQTHWIMETLTKAKSGEIACELADPNDYLFIPREAKPEHQGEPEQLPSLFLYLLNIFAKKIVKQFCEECGANPRQADPLGILSVQIFSKPLFQWRGESLIDILLAKFFLVCPVVLGARGDEKTNAGRAAVGWQCQGSGGAFIPDTAHYNRMTGLGAGFAALTLRDFSRSTNRAPVMPRHYWCAFASIVGTPPTEICSTQLVVLKSMIEHHEHRFFLFYGNLAIAALRYALIDVPKRCPEQNSAVGALKVLGELLAKKTGLPLA